MQTTKTNNYVFLTAENACIVVHVNNVVVATTVQTAQQLLQVFTQYNINMLTDTIMCSSSIDFAAEEGFATDNCAHNIIDSVKDILVPLV